MSSARRTTALVIGAGHSGLAMSRCLDERSIDHVLLERGSVAHSWKTERWDSLRLLTPNWQSRLPGYAYQGDDPDGFMTVPEVVRFIEDYSDVISAPVHTSTSVESVTRTDGGYLVRTDQGDWRCRVVVLASGACNRQAVPAVAEALPDHVRTLAALDYRSPDQLEDGGVLVVGASATGTQLADEIHRSGRPVTLAVGEHVRMPRVYRGRDIQWWLDRSGLLDERYDEVDDIVRARHVASPQLTGSVERRTLDINALTAQGVRLTGRLGGFRNDKALFSGSLRNVCALADLKMGRMLDTVDEWAADVGMDGEVDSPQRFEPTEVEKTPPLEIDLADAGIKTVVWATGFKPDYRWLDVDVLDRKGMIKHDGGVVVDSPGMYLLGITFLRRRKSSFIHGAEDDARDLADHMAGHLAGTARRSR